jgi:hypothetical protein
VENVRIHFPLAQSRASETEQDIGGLSGQQGIRTYFFYGLSILMKKGPYLPHRHNAAPKPLIFVRKRMECIARP